MKTADDLTTELRTLILTDMVPLSDKELANDASLVDDVLDSLGIAELAVFVEDEIGRPLEPAEETRATFATIDTLVRFIITHR